MAKATFLCLLNCRYINNLLRNFRHSFVNFLSYNFLVLSDPVHHREQGNVCQVREDYVKILMQHIHIITGINSRVHKQNSLKSKINQ